MYIDIFFFGNVLYVKDNLELYYKKDKMEDTYEVKVYKLWYEDNPSEVYIGSTKEKYLSTRMSKHRGDVKKGKTTPICNLIREKGNNFKYILIASCMVHNFDEQRAFEQQWIDSLTPILNTNRAYNNEEYNKQYHKDYKQSQKYKDYSRQYCQRTEVKAKKNTDESKLKQKNWKASKKRNCECGGKYYDIDYYKKAHDKSKRHIKFVETQNN